MLTRTDVDGSGTAHRHLVTLRDATGGAAFPPSADQLVAVFTLFPLVHTRLQQLVAESATLSVPSRPIPDRWVLRLPFPADLDALRTLVDDPAAQLEDLGFGSDLRPLPRPMTAGRRTTVDERESLIAIPMATTAHLHCFDPTGAPVDPGAVAALFSALVGEYDNLGEPDLRITPAEGRRVHLTGSGGGAVTASDLAAIRVDGGIPTAALAGLGAGDQQVDVADTTARPHLRLSTLPDGSRSSTVALADSTLLPRDTIRLGVVDYASLLTGTDRSTADQQRASTRIEVAPTADGPTLLASADEVLGAMRTALSATARGDALAVLGAPDGGIGPFPAPPTLPDIDPTGYDDVTIAPLHGGSGPEQGDFSPAMRAVMTFRFPPEMVGAWVRVMPLGFDRNRAERVRMVGGSGVVAPHASGPRAVVVVTLPPGPSTRTVAVTFDVEILTAIGRHIVSALSLDRPLRPLDTAVPDTTPVVLGPTGSVPDLFVCETAGTQIVSGYTAVVERGGAFLAVDEGATPGDRYLSALAASLRPADRVVLTTPTWTGEPSGDGLAKLCALANPPTLVHRRRSDITRLAEPGEPLPGHEARNIIVSTTSATASGAVLSGGGLRADSHQIVGPPGGLAGEPAIAECHVAGVRLSGPAARLLHEVAMADTHASTSDLLTAAIALPTPPIAPTGPTRWASVLRTTRANIEGERTIDAAALAQDYPVAGSDAERRAWLTSAILGAPPTPSGTDAQAAFDRAAARRVTAAVSGLSEAIAALRGAISSAQRFIYIEAPSLTACKLSGTGSDFDLIGLLRQALADRPGLHALVCVPQRSRTPFPHLNRFRTTLQTRVREIFTTLAASADGPTDP